MAIPHHQTDVEKGLPQAPPPGTPFKKHQQCTAEAATTTKTNTNNYNNDNNNYN